MPKKKNNFIIIALVVLAFFAFSNGTFFQGAITGSEEAARMGMPNQAAPGGSFQVTYAMGGEGDRAVSIYDSLVGGCTFPGGKTTYQDVLISDISYKKTVTITTPNEYTVCKFTNGDYKFGTFGVVDFPDAQVTVGSPPCTPDWRCPDCGGDCVDANNCDMGDYSTPPIDGCTECNSNADCSGCKDTCVSGTCQQLTDQVCTDCNSDADCGVEEECRDNQCKPVGMVCGVLIGYKITNNQCTEQVGCPTDTPDYSTLNECQADIPCDEAYTPATSEVCAGTVYEQKRCEGQPNQETREATGVMANCGSGCSDPNYDGTDPAIVCIGDTTTHINSCGDTKEVDGTKEGCESEDDKCEFWESEKEGKCKLNTGMIVLAFVALLFIRMMG